MVCSHQRVARRGSGGSLIYDEHAQGAGWVAVPVTRLDPAFFDLRTGVAGEFVQKFVVYRRDSRSWMTSGRIWT